MESTCEIIELYGLPGCGKTTLCEAFKRKFSEGEVADINDIFQKIRTLSRSRRLLLIPLSVVIPLLCLWFTCPILSYRQRGIYRAFLKRIAVISYIKKTNQYRYAILDHGIVQCAHSLYLGREQYFTKKAEKKFLSVLKCFSPIKYVYCSVPVDTAIERITIRKALNHGRLDSIDNLDTLKRILQEQEIFFTNVFAALSCALEDANLRVEMRDNSVEVAMTLTRSLKSK